MGFFDTIGGWGKKGLDVATGGLTHKGGTGGMLQDLLGTGNPMAGRYDTSAYGYLTDKLRGQIEGQGPNIAEEQMRANAGTLSRNMQGAYGGMKGISPGLAAALVGRYGSDAGAQMGAQSAQIRAQQQLADQDRLISLLKAGMGIGAGAEAQNAAQRAGLVGGVMQAAGGLLGMADGGEIPETTTSPMAFDSDTPIDPPAGVGMGSASEGTPLGIPAATKTIPTKGKAGKATSKAGDTVAQSGQAGLSAFYAGMQAPNMLAEGGEATIKPPVYKPPERPLPDVVPPYYEGETAKAEHAAKAAAEAPPVEKAPVTGMYEYLDLVPRKQKMAYGGAPVFMADGTVPGSAPYAGDTEKNDVVDAKLSPGEIVIPRSIAKSPNAPEEAAAFVAHLMRRQSNGYAKVAAAKGKLAEGGKVEEPTPHEEAPATVGAEGDNDAQKFIRHLSKFLGVKEPGVIQKRKELYKDVEEKTKGE